MSEMVKLQPLAMLVPNTMGVYAPSKLDPVQEVEMNDFLDWLVDRGKPKELLVSWEEDGISNPVKTTVYRYIVGAYYMVINGPGVRSE